ncbi:MAG: hypothetical protein JW982_17160 [Spirochaetes bacterium]|nr:hypothetical protein [Spirochaetota bacterium]
MEKIISGNLRIQIAGPLSRNDRLKNLKTGDIVTARILSKIDKFTAVLELYGNKVKGNFTFQVPDVASMKLVITGNKDGFLSFRMTDESDKFQDIRKLLAGLPLIKNELLFLIINSVRNSDFSFFHIYEQFFMKNRDFLNKKKQMKKFSAETVKKSNLQNLVFQSAFNDASAEEIDLIYKFLSLFELFDNEGGILEIDDSAAEIFSVCYQKPDKKAPSVYFFENRDKEVSDIKIMHHPEVFLFKADFSQIGRIEVLASNTGAPRIDVFYENISNEKIVVDKMNKMTEVISDSILLFLWEKSFFLEKILDFSQKENRVDIKA